MVESFEKSCGIVTEYGLKYLKYFAEMCDRSNMLTEKKFKPLVKFVQLKNDLIDL